MITETITLKSQIEEAFEGVELDKAMALAEVLGLDLEGDSEITLDGNFTFEVDGMEYNVLDGEERVEEVTEYIKDTLWAFNPSFLAQETDYDLLPVFEAMVKADMCESANEAILCLIEKLTTLEDFVESATSADGYGHFLSHYDGCELEVYKGIETYYIYRQN